MTERDDPTARAAAYAVNADSDLEHAETEALRAGDPALDAEIAEFAETAALLGLAVFVVPFVMFGAAFLLYELHRLLPLVLGPAGVPLARGMRAFSLVTLFGAVLLLFF